MNLKPGAKIRFVGFYSRQFAFIKRMKRFVLIAAVIFLATAAVAVIVLIPNPGRAERITTEFFSKYRSRHQFSGPAFRMFLQIAWNNLRVALMTCLFGLIPFFLGSIIAIISAAWMLGLIFVYVLIKHSSIPVLFLSIVPHGIIEIPTLIFVSGFSLYLSSQMTRRIFQKRNTWMYKSADLFGFVRPDGQPDRIEAIGIIAEIYAGIIIPLVLIAALIESFITPFVIRIFG